ncbi:hypothetical protein [Lactonifactor longoviformis]|uniref:hypothetical protein n=1 Tax=Lactonifactor longoviformis TaxID=341220 RepID=UPI0036F2AB3F
MVLLFSEYKQIAKPSNVNEFIGDCTLVLGVVCTVGYPIGGSTRYVNSLKKKSGRRS